MLAAGGGGGGDAGIAQRAALTPRRRRTHSIAPTISEKGQQSASRLLDLQLDLNYISVNTKT